MAEELLRSWSIEESEGAVKNPPLNLLVSVLELVKLSLGLGCPLCDLFIFFSIHTSFLFSKEGRDRIGLQNERGEGNKEEKEKEKERVFF